MDAPTVEKKRKPGRPKKVQDEAPLYEQELIAPSQMEDIKHVIRTLDWDGLSRDGSMPANMIEEHLKNTYFDNGYLLERVIELGNVAGEGERPFSTRLLYVLVKYAE